MLRESNISFGRGWKMRTPTWISREHGCQDYNGTVENKKELVFIAKFVYFVFDFSKDFFAVVRTDEDKRSKQERPSGEDWNQETDYGDN